MLIAGTADQEDNLKRAANELGIVSNVHFLGVRLDMPELVRAFDVFVMPSVWEGLPMALLEAFAASTPMVASDVGGISKVIRHRENGSLVPARDPAALAAELAHVLERPELRKKYGEAARQTFEESYSAEAMIRRYEAVYLEAVA